MHKQYIKKLKHFVSDTLPREVQMLKRLSHPHLVKLLHYNPEAGEITMQDHGTAVSKTNLSVAEITAMITQLLDVLGYMHQNAVVHSDVKPDNITCYYRDNHPVFTLIDLGSAVDFTNTITLDSYTMIYSAPEILSGMSLSDPEKIDVWSLGVTLLEKITGSNPFAGATKTAILRNIFNQLVVSPGTAEQLNMLQFARRGYNKTPLISEFHNRYETDAEVRECNKHLRNLVLSMLTVDPASRPTVQQIYKNENYIWLLNHAGDSVGQRRFRPGDFCKKMP